MPPQPLSAIDMVIRAGTLGVSLVQFADNLPLHELSASELDELELVATDRGSASRSAREESVITCCATPTSLAARGTAGDREPVA